MVCAKERVRTNRRVNFHALRTVFDAAHKGASEVRTVCGSAASTVLCGGWLATAIPTATGLLVGFELFVRRACVAITLSNVLIRKKAKTSHEGEGFGVSPRIFDCHFPLQCTRVRTPV